ncbi:MAG: inner membrane CreD family protein [Opitutaceae bacterium]
MAMRGRALRSFDAAMRPDCCAIEVRFNSRSPPALTLFYLGFLALGDFIGAGWAYALAALASSSLISGYSWSVLKTGSRTAFVASGLLVTYGGLYLILRMQDYALLAGSAVLFVLLAAIMWFTRRIDWYGNETRAGSA